MGDLCDVGRVGGVLGVEPVAGERISMKLECQETQTFLFIKTKDSITGKEENKTPMELGIDPESIVAVKKKIRVGNYLKN